MFFAKTFHIPNQKSAELPLLKEYNFEVESNTFRVKRNRVQHVLGSLDECKSVGLDGISPRVLEQIPALSLTIMWLLWKIAQSRLFPEDKVAHITPIHKNVPQISYHLSTVYYSCCQHSQPHLRESYHSWRSSSCSILLMSSLGLWPIQVPVGSRHQGLKCLQGCNQYQQMWALSDLIRCPQGANGHRCCLICLFRSCLEKSSMQWCYVMQMTQPSWWKYQQVGERRVLPYSTPTWRESWTLARNGYLSSRQKNKNHHNQ